VSEVLDDSLDLIVSEQVDGVSGGVQFFLKVGLESMDNESGFEVLVGSEDL